MIQNVARRIALSAGLLLGVSAVGIAEVKRDHDSAGADRCAPLTARTLSQVCSRISDAGLQSQCFAAGRDAYMDECALGACDRFFNSGSTVQCVDVIADRYYTIEEVLACDRNTETGPTITCFENSGRTARQPNIATIRSFVYDALSELRNDRPNEARATLYDLLEYLDRNK